MNYIKEINAFYDWLETNSLSDSAINLWHALMHINNRAGWIMEFTVAISTLENKTGLKKDAIIRARLKLQQFKRIDFKSRSGQQSAVYNILPFDSHRTTQSNEVGVSDVLNDTNHNTNRAQSTTQTASQTASINKLNETALNGFEGSSNNRNSYTNVFGVYQREIGELGEYIKEKLIELELTYSEDWVKRAIGVAVYAGEKTMRFIQGVLRKWKELNHPEPWTIDKPQQAAPKQHSNYNRGSPGKGTSNKPHIPMIAESTVSGRLSDEARSEFMLKAKLLDGDITQEEYDSAMEEWEVKHATAT